MRLDRLVIVGAAALLVILATGARAHADPGPPGPGGFGEHGLGHMFRPEMIDMIGSQLGVGDAVLKQIKERVFKAEQESIKLRADLETAQLELQRLMDDDKPDQAKVLHQVDVVGDAEKLLKKNRIGLLLSVRELLTPEQRHQLMKIMAERMEGHGGQRPGQGDGPGAETHGAAPRHP